MDLTDYILAALPHHEQSMVLCTVQSVLVIAISSIFYIFHGFITKRNITLLTRYHSAAAFGGMKIVGFSGRDQVGGVFSPPRSPSLPIAITLDLKRRKKHNRNTQYGLKHMQNFIDVKAL